MTPIPQFSHTVVKSYFYLKPWSAWLHSIPTAAPDLLFLPIYASSSLPWASRPSGRAAPAAWAGRRRSGVAHRRGGPAARRAGADGVGGGAAGLVGTGAGGQRQGAPASRAAPTPMPARMAERRGKLVAGLAGPGGGAVREAAGGRAGTEAEIGVGRRWGWDGVRESAPDARPKTARDRASERKLWS